MKKEFRLLFLVAILTLFVPSVMAAEKTASTDAELIKAINEAVTGDTVKLTADIEHTGGKILVGDGKDITLDLNGHNIVTKLETDRSITVYDGILTIKGKGTIKHETNNALNVWGSDTETTKVYSKLNVGKDVTLEGTTGIAIFRGNKDEGAYGVEVNFEGKINAQTKGITTNGFITHINGPVVNIKNGAKITTTGEDGVAVYAAGNGTYNIEEGATITGATAVEVRAGILNVKGGVLTGTSKTIISDPESNGPTTVGAGVAVVQHTTKLPISVNIFGGTIKGAAALYVNNTQGNSAEDWAKVNAVVTGGTFSNDVTAYVDSKYVVSLTNGQYKVVENKTLENNNKNVVFASETALDNTYVLEVTELSDETKEEVETTLNKYYADNKEVKDTTLITIYDISVSDGVEIVPMENGKFTISIDIDDEKEFDNYKVIYVDSEGKISEVLDAKRVGNKIVFETTHLSTYGVVGYNNVTTTVNNPNTGDNLNMIILLGGLSLLILGMSAYKLSKNN